MAALILLECVVLLFSPFILLKKVLRTVRKGSTHELDPGRFLVGSDVTGCAPKDPRRLRVVLFGPSLGELRLVQSLSRRLLESEPGLDVIWCSGDRGTLAFSKENFPAQSIVLSPYENAYSVSRWLSAVRPDAIILMEKFWLPHLLALAKLKGCETAVVNARTNRKDGRGGALLAPYYRWVVRNVDLFCCQSPEAEGRIRAFALPSQQLAVTGNLKMDVVTSGLETTRRSIGDWLGQGAPLLAAGSTGSDLDEEFVLDAFERVRLAEPCRLLIAPRKTKRSDEVEAAIRRRGLRVNRRSTGGGDSADVYLLDTLGELMAAYSWCEAAFIGDTLVGAGHNILEPLAWHIPVAYGPSRGHFGDLQTAAEAANVGFRCHTSNELAEIWKRAIEAKDFRAQVKSNAEELLTASAGATGRTAHHLLWLFSCGDPEGSHEPHT